MMDGADRAALGFVIICVSVVLLALLVLWALLPSPHRAETALPLDREGYSYRCYCWRDPVTVTIRTEQGRRRHAREERPTLRDRIRSWSSPNVGAECGPGVHPEPVAA
ncbi:hypothetical protein [Streptomyces californicus]|uniref:hypothetical protein n=1 Tax=Streptomyces californicus TaxID=67351 RepID=UPI0037BC8E70